MTPTARVSRRWQEVWNEAERLVRLRQSEDHRRVCRVPAGRQKQIVIPGEDGSKRHDARDDVHGACQRRGKGSSTRESWRARRHWRTSSAATRAM